MTTEGDRLFIRAEEERILREALCVMTKVRLHNIVERLHVVIKCHYIVSQHPINRSNWRLPLEKEEMVESLRFYDELKQKCDSMCETTFSGKDWCNAPRIDYDTPIRADFQAKAQNTARGFLEIMMGMASEIECILTGTEMHLSNLEQRLRDHIYRAKPAKRYCRKRRI